ncbi:MAG: hypothetical protein F4056_02820 [Chloroflexi bacterium]|nr:hypothetical protein [Chloroflexota bacterium]
MTLQRDGEQPQAEVAALLRAVGQLLVAISGDETATPAQPAAPPQPRTRTAPPMDEVEQILAEARARAQQLIDESFADAREQIEALAAADAPPEEPPPAGEPAGELGEKLRSLQELLGDIDALQQAQEAEEPPAEPESEAPEPEAAMEAPPAVSREPDAAAERPEVVEDAGAERVEAVAWSEDEAGADVVFNPEGGSVLLRVTPVEGFQGLLRVQGALAQLAGVRQASVEGYAEGEAQLRLTFDAAAAVGALGAALGERLDVRVEAADVSEAERSLRFELR